MDCQAGAYQYENIAPKIYRFESFGGSDGQPTCQERQPVEQGVMDKRPASLSPAGDRPALPVRPRRSRS